MTDERIPDRELSTADVAAAAQRAEREADIAARRLDDREVAIERGADRREVPESEAWAGTPLLDADLAERMRARWTEIQTGFVDEPRRAVEEADTLVAEAIKRLAESFAGTRSQLEANWARGDDVSTEDLRQTLQRYRAFFGRLLEV